MNRDKIVVCGAGGFIGGHLVADLLRQGCRSLRAVESDAYPAMPEDGIRSPPPNFIQVFALV